MSKRIFEMRGGPDSKLSDNYWEILARIRALQKALGLSQTELANLTGTTQSAISDMVRGVTEPRLGTAIHALEAMGHTLSVTENVPFSSAYHPRRIHYTVQSSAYAPMNRLPDAAVVLEETRLAQSWRQMLYVPTEFQMSPPQFVEVPASYVQRLSGVAGPAGALAVATR